MKDDDFNVCEECGASVYSEHLESGIAKYVGGKLYCSHCVVGHERDAGGAGGDPGEFAPIDLDRDDDGGGELDMSSSRIQQTMTDSQIGRAARDDAQFRRALQPNARGATRCRTFHCRISEGAVDFMNNQINEWLDSRDDITIKFSTSVIGMFEGKHTEPNLILTLFY